MHQVEAENFWMALEKFAGRPIEDVEGYFCKQNRSSTIFPIFKDKNSNSSISFLTYWLKKHGNNVVIKLTARDQDGVVRGIEWFPILEFYALTYNADEFEYFKNCVDGFSGSLEVEVYSKDPPLYTFPAISLIFSNPESSSVVHSCIRTYNDDEVIQDYAINFPQTGFDVLFGSDLKNYVCFFGGSQSSYDLELELLQDDHCQTVKVNLQNAKYGQMHLIYLEDVFLDTVTGSSAKLAISHNLDVFPRFYVGIVKSNFVPTLTHTFFDTSERNFEQKNDDFINLRAKICSYSENFDAAFMVPIYPNDKFHTLLNTYDQNLLFSGEIQIKLFSENGTLINARVLDEKEVQLWNKISSFDISKEAEALGVSTNEHCSMFFGFSDPDKPFPKRFHLGGNYQ